MSSRTSPTAACATVLDDWSAVETSIYAIYPSSRHLVAKVRAFVDFLVEELATRPGHER